MLNLDLSEMDLSVLRCVNPYEVNPISGITEIQPPEEIPEKKVKLEMEEFSDLAPFLPETTPDRLTYTDELNTPIFANTTGPFDFMVNKNTYIQPQTAADLAFTTPRLSAGKSTNHFSVFSNNMSAKLQDTPSTGLVNIVHGSEANLFFTTEAGQGNIFIINGNETPALGEDQISASVFKVEDTNSVISANSNENQYSNVSSPITEYYLSNDIKSNEADCSNISSPDHYKAGFGLETPEDSDSSASLNTKLKPHLKLNLGFQGFPVLNTPDVIDSVVALESSFNILDYISEKDVIPVNVEDIHFGFESTSQVLDFKPSKGRKRKPKRYDDENDDEDYVPPTKKVAERKKSVHFDSDSDSDEEVEAKRRPPRRTSSISSDHSDASKYRELRDKNNEASRKSRLKRKVKEVSLEKEADGLEEKNVKLKAQVGALEKMVNNFRTNLFQIMLKK